MKGIARETASHLILQAWWSRTRADVVTTATPESALGELEARYRITIPADFRLYLAQGAPAAENWDATDGNWWPAKRIKSLADAMLGPASAPVRKNAAKHLIFLDCAIWSWAWAISCADDETYGKVAIIGSLEDGYVADSFAQFVNNYTVDWTLVSKIRKGAKLIDRVGAWLQRGGSNRQGRVA